MSFTHSRSAIDIKLEIYEVEALIDWHHENQYRSADRAEYQEAANSKQRSDELEGQLKAHRDALSLTSG